VVRNRLPARPSLQQYHLFTPLTKDFEVEQECGRLGHGLTKGDKTQRRQEQGWQLMSVGGWNSHSFGRKWVCLGVF
jgi:hypothetical protein